MKRIKIMLLSFALLTVIGGALAFKAKFGPISDICYTTTTAVTTACELISTSFTAEGPGRTTYYTTPAVFFNEDQQWHCYTTHPQNPAITTSLTCTTAGVLKKDL